MLDTTWLSLASPMALEIEVEQLCGICHSRLPSEPPMSLRGSWGQYQSASLRLAHDPEDELTQDADLKFGY